MGTGIIRLGRVVLLLCAVSLVAGAACSEGTVPCRRNGCPGVRECINGRFQGCEIEQACIHQPPIVDRIVVDLAVPGQEIGLLVDGNDGQSFNDRRFYVSPSGTTATAFLPNVTAPAFGNSVIAFGRSRQPAILQAPWTTHADTIHGQMLNNIRFNVTFWIMAGNFATQSLNVATAVLGVNNAYVFEKAGLRIAFVTIKDATANPNTPALLAGGSQGAYQTGIGFNPGEINIYVINTVIGSQSAGANFDGTPVILLGQSSLIFPQLIEHELGHAFVLWHTGGLPGFDSFNVMAPAVSGQSLSEGQIFRMHFHPSSQLNVFNLRPGQPTFVCGEPATDNCPANNKRLWADGVLPPN